MILRLPRFALQNPTQEPTYCIMCSPAEARARSTNRPLRYVIVGLLSGFHLLKSVTFWSSFTSETNGRMVSDS